MQGVRECECLTRGSPRGAVQAASVSFASTKIPFSIDMFPKNFDSQSLKHLCFQRGIAVIEGASRTIETKNGKRR